MKSVTRIQILDEADYFRKGMNPSLSQPGICKLSDSLVYSTVVWQPAHEKEHSELYSANKVALSRILHMMDGLGKQYSPIYIYIYIYIYNPIAWNFLSW